MIHLPVWREYLITLVFLLYHSVIYLFDIFEKLFENHIPHCVMGRFARYHASRGNEHGHGLTVFRHAQRGPEALLALITHFSQYPLKVTIVTSDNNGTLK